MTINSSDPLFHKLRRLGIRHYDELIHEQSSEWLIENFSFGSTKYPINVTKLMRNIIWQTKERIQNKQREPLNELIRTFWYMYIKPTLARAGSLSTKTDQYAQLVDQLVFLVVDKKIMQYQDIGFRDDNKLNRKAGLNANIILFSEKLGHQDFLGEIADLYGVSILALGGQPSALTVEYFVNELREKGVDLRRSFFLFSIVDYDTSGWIIRDAFIKDLIAYGISNIQCTELITPDMLTPEEIQYSKYPIRDTKSTQKKNTRWLSQIRKMDYKNQKYMAQEIQNKKRILYGLEAESVSGKRIREVLEKEMVPLLGKDERLLRIFQLEQLNEAIKQLILHIVT